MSEILDRYLKNLKPSSRIHIQRDGETDRLYCPDIAKLTHLVTLTIYIPIYIYYRVSDVSY